MVPAGVEELSAGDPRAVALENARRKAAAVAARHPGRPVLGVDTVVALDGRIYDKPADAAEARATLRALSGRTHEVISGVALGERSVAATTRVTFRPLERAPDPLIAPHHARSASWVEWYVALGEWRDRAGGYAIQGAGAALVTRVEGDYLNVVGLPLAALIDLAA